MRVDVIVGLQWGDEGKGKIVDVFANRYDVIVRFQGGPNAGHTLEFDGIKHILHTIPSGIFHRDKINLIGNGVIIDPVILANELKKLEPYNIDYSQNLFVSRRAHLILPSHRLLDACYEYQKGDTKIGSTLKGIGPAYTDKIARNGLRVGNIEDSKFFNRYEYLKEYHMLLIEAMGYTSDQFSIDGQPFDEYEERWLKSIEELKTLKLVDGELFINELITKGKRILAEGAQGTMLDVEFGSYPYVTSSNTISGGVCTGLGLAPRHIGEIYGIFKAYCTRVGSGPFPTELFDETGDLLRKNGNEFGSTTGRPRRCGWIDLPALKYACMLNGVTQLIMTKADVMNEFPSIKLCHGYKIDDDILKQWDFRCDYKKTVPLYREVDGWTTNLGKIKSSDDIPPSLTRYTGIIKRETGVEVTYVSTGPDRSQIIAL